MFLGLLCHLSVLPYLASNCTVVNSDLMWGLYGITSSFGQELRTDWSFADQPAVTVGVDTLSVAVEVSNSGFSRISFDPVEWVLSISRSTVTWPRLVEPNFAGGINDSVVTVASLVFLWDSFDCFIQSTVTWPRILLVELSLAEEKLLLVL